VTSPLESFGIFLTVEQSEDVLDRIEERALEGAEDDQAVSLPSDESAMSPRALVLAIGATDK
jgi:hypothetical protein